MKKLYALFIFLTTVLSASAQLPHVQDGVQARHDIVTLKPQIKVIPLNKQRAKAPALTATVTRNLSFCDGQFNNALGFNIAYGDSSMVAVYFSKEDLEPFVGGKIKSIRYPFYDTEAAGSVSKLYGWVALDDPNNTVSQKRSLFARANWNTITLGEPVEIDGEHDIFIGVSIVSKSQSYPITILAVPGPNYSGLVNQANCGDEEIDDWADISSQYGMAAIEAVVEGVTVPEMDLAVTGIDLPYYNVLISSPVSVFFEAFNRGAEDVTSFDVEIYVNGELVKKEAMTCAPIAIGKSQSFSVTDVAHGLTSEIRAADLELKVVNINGKGDDENMNNNAAKAKFGAFAQMLPRKMLVEEGTGTWCGYCPRGYVGMEQMAAEHPDDFVGVAVHCDDEMDFVIDEENVATYANYAGYSGFPSAIIDRMYYDVDPNYGALTSYYQYQLRNQTIATLDAAAYWKDENHIIVKGNATFCYNGVGGDNFSLVTLLLEDEVGPYAQANYYSGSGEDMGGFENLGQYVPLRFNDVLRGVYPDFYGFDAILPEPLEKGISAGKPVPFSYTYEITPTVYTQNRDWTLGPEQPRYQDKEKLRVAVLLVDLDYMGVVINATKSNIGPIGSAINGITGNGRSLTSYYDLNGTRLSAPARKGVYIEKQGDKVVKRLAR